MYVVPACRPRSPHGPKQQMLYLLKLAVHKYQTVVGLFDPNFALFPHLGHSPCLLTRFPEQVTSLCVCLDRY